MAKKGKKGGKGKKGKKGGGAKTPTLLGGISVDEMTPEQLIENIGQLKEEVILIIRNTILVKNIIPARPRKRGAQLFPVGAR